MEIVPHCDYCGYYYLKFIVSVTQSFTELYHVAKRKRPSAGLSRRSLISLDCGLFALLYSRTLILYFCHALYLRLLGKGVLFVVFEFAWRFDLRFKGQDYVSLSDLGFVARHVKILTYLIFHCHLLTPPDSTVHEIKKQQLKSKIIV